MTASSFSMCSCRTCSFLGGVFCGSAKVDHSPVSTGGRGGVAAIGLAFSLTIKDFYLDATSSPDYYGMPHVKCRTASPGIWHDVDHHYRESISSTTSHIFFLSPAALQTLDHHVENNPIN